MTEKPLEDALRPMPDAHAAGPSQSAEDLALDAGQQPPQPLQTNADNYLPGPTFRKQAALLALAWLAFALRVSGLTSQSLWRDEVDSLRFATRALPELLAMFTRPGENGPLYFLALRPWLAVAGQSEFALRLPPALAGALAVPLAYALARRLLRIFSPVSAGRPLNEPILANIPLLLALLIAINPYLIWYGQEGKMYSLLLSLVLASSLAFLAALKDGRWPRWLLYLGLLALSALIHVLSTLLIPVHAVWLLLAGKPYRRRWLPFLLTLLLPALPFFALAGWWQLRLFLMPDFQTGHPVVSLSGMVRVLLLGLSSGVAAPIEPLVVALIIFLLLVGLVTTFREGNWQMSALLLAWLLLPVLLLFAISLRKPLFADRYLIWIGPAFLLLLAYGLRGLGNTWRPLGWLGLAGLLLLFGRGGWLQATTPIKSDFRAAVAYVIQHRRPGDLLLFQLPYGRYTFEYYAGPGQPWADGPYTNNDNPPEQVSAEMARAVDAAPAVWLIASEEALWDRRQLTRAWLNQHGQATDRAALTRVEVIRYEMQQR